MSTAREDGTILMVAYQCGPGMGSVSQIGWEWFSGMSALRQVCLVTHVRNRAALEAAPNRPAAARIVYIDTEWFAGPLYRFSKRLFPRSEHATLGMHYTALHSLNPHELLWYTQMWSIDGQGSTTGLFGPHLLPSVKNRMYSWT